MDNITLLQTELAHHPVYSTFSNLSSIRHFMQHHVFAVWDFMSLLKSLQRHITCVELPWRPSAYPAEMVRLINQIVVGEESDLDQRGRPISHFELYLLGMEEIGASTVKIRDFLSDLNPEKIPSGTREFVQGNLKVAATGHVVEVAASFFFGREKLIPEMFEAMVKTLKEERVEAPTFLYYLERHIEVDGGEHGPLAMQCLDSLINNDPKLRQIAMEAGVKALHARKKLWDHVLASLA